MHNLKSKKKKKKYFQGNYIVITYCESILGFGFVRNIWVISGKLKENFTLIEVFHFVHTITFCTEKRKIEKYNRIF